VEAGTALDYCDNFGCTALWAAAQRGHKSIIRFLLEKGSCVNMPDCEGLTPMDIAARKSFWHAVDEFLKHHLIIRPEGIEYLKNQLYEASESGDLETVRIILNCGINVDTTNKNGYTPLHVAAKCGHTEITRVLLKSCASVNTPESSGRRPINLAAVNGHIEIIRQLLSAEAISDCSKSLYLAATRGHVEVVRDMLNYCASVNNTNDEGFTPLRSAAAKGMYK
jgi:serine/threonine-protein phosphatase 6 regulatory ankyrin repeat subunit B